MRRWSARFVACALALPLLAGCAAKPTLTAGPGVTVTSIGLLPVKESPTTIKV